MYENIIKASKDGYDAVELHIPDAEVLEIENFNSFCLENKMKISAISTGLAYTERNLSLTNLDSNIRKEAIDCLKKHIEAASILKSGVIIGLIRGNFPPDVKREKTIKILKEALYYVLDEAEKKQVPIYFETIHRFILNNFCSIDETIDFVKSFKSSFFRLHIDTYHMALEESDFSNSIYKTNELLGYVHYSDNNRRIPGLGNLDFFSITKSLKHINYNGYVALECEPSPNLDKVRKLGAQYTKTLFELVYYR